MAETDWLFVYGSLRPASGHPMASWLAGRSEYAGSAHFQGRLFLIDDYPGAIDSDLADDLVQGDLLRLSDPSATLRLLDEYEECGPGFPHPSEFLREIRTIWDDKNGRRLAWLYLYQRPWKNLQAIPSGDFLAPAL